MAEISKTADQALTVLLTVSEHGPCTPARLARDLKMNRTVVHRLLSTLHQRGFVTRQEEGYIPGAILVRIAEHVQPRLRAAGREAMEQVARKVDETVVMHIPDGDDAVVLEQVVSDNHLVRVEHQIGSRHPLVTAASGRAILAFLGDPVIERVARRVDASDDVKRKLKAVRKAGYALSHDELQQGVHGLAVPVLNGDGCAIASMAILVPTTRAADLEQHSKLLLDAAARLSKAVRSRD